MRPQLIMSALLISGVYMASVVHAHPVGFVPGGDNYLYRIDNVANPIAVKVGPMFSYNAGITAMAISPAGELYAADANGVFCKIDVHTGAPTYIGNIGRASAAMAFRGDELVAIEGFTQSGTRRIVAIDLATGARSTLVYTTSSIEGPRDIEIEDASHMLVLAYDGLVRVDLTTGDVAYLGALPAAPGVWYALGRAEDGTLYGVAENFQFYTIDTTSLAVTFVGASNVGVRSLTIIDSSKLGEGHDIWASAGAGGAIMPAGDVRVNDGDDQVFTITPEPCHHIRDVLVDDVSAGTVTSYTFANVQGDHTIAATFSEDFYTITATVGPGGSISPSGAVSVGCAGGETFEITPADECHVIADVKVDGLLVGAVASYTFTGVQANHTIDATFTLLGPYTLTASAGPGGSINPAGTVSVACGANETFTITQDPCYIVSDVLVDGVSVGAVNSYTFTDVQADHIIAASFVVAVQYTIASSAGAGGSISPMGNTPVTCGADETYTITPDACYDIADVLVDGVLVGAVNTHTFTNVLANHTIAASFVLKTFTIAASAGPGGSISPAGNVTVNCDASEMFTITPDKCHMIADVNVDGPSVGAVASYAFTGVQANHTIDATFTLLGPYTITASAAPGGSINPAGTVSAACGANETFAITTDPSCRIASVFVDEMSIGPVAIYTFSDVTANHSISAAFTVLAPTVQSVVDVGNDQGREVRATWTSSYADQPVDPTPVIRYDVFRRIDQLPLVAGQSPPVAENRLDPNGSMLAGWDLVVSVPAACDDEYSVVVPTLADSNMTGMHWSVFMVRAATATPSIHYDSAPHSGYSVDNLLPLAPADFTVTYENASANLHWSPNRETDFCAYRVYHGDSPDFIPGPDNLVTTTGSTSYVDAHPVLCYKVSAVDLNGNESQYAQLQTPLDVPRNVAIAFSIRVSPNPASGNRLIVNCSLPHAAPGRIELVDVTGRLVAQQYVTGIEQHTINLAGNRRFPPGLYLIRLTQGSTSRVARVIVVQ